MFGIKKTKRSFEPETGERLLFILSNNGNKKWENVDLQTKNEALDFLNDCIASIEKMKNEIKTLKHYL